MYSFEDVIRESQVRAKKHAEEHLKLRMERSEEFFESVRNIDMLLDGRRNRASVLDDYHEIIADYADAGFTQEEIAKKIKSSISQVHRYMKKHGMVVRKCK